MKPTPAGLLVMDWLERMQDTPSKTLARAIYAKRPELWPSLEACYLMVRHYRGNHGTYSRKYAAVAPHLHRPNQAAGFQWKFPASSAETWKPYDVREKDTLLLSDLHIPFHDSRAIHAVIGSAVARNPDAILLNGDVCDFFSISRFDKNPTKSSLAKEIELTRAFLGWLRQKFKRARIIYKFGNHDEWFGKYLWRKAPELFGLPQIELPHILTQKTASEPEIGGIEFLTNQEKITLGSLDVLHGHELGKGSIAPPVNPARGFFLKTMECTLAGHLHRSSQHQERSSKGKNISCWSTGCLCGLYPDYAKINKWDHSAAHVELSGRNFRVTPIRVIDGELI